MKKADVPKFIKVNGAVYKLADTPGATPVTAKLTVTGSPDSGYTVTLDRLEDNHPDFASFSPRTVIHTLPIPLRNATGRSGHEALASLADAWSRAGFLD